MRKIQTLQPVHPLFDNPRVKAAIPKPENIWNLDEIPHDRQEAWDWLISQMSVCEKCLLSKTRNKVVLPDGNLSASVMVVLQNPAVNEDLTGIPLTGAMELRASDCGRCTKVERCYSGRLLKNEKDFPKRAIPVVCNPDLQKDPLLARNFFLRTTGTIVDGILVEAFGMDQPRLNWVKEYNRNNPNAALPDTSPWLFTNTISCRPTDEERVKDLPEITVPKAQCKPWLILQWVILQPKVIITLGQESLTAFISNNQEKSQIFVNEPYESKWGTILFNTHPASIMRDPVKESKGLSYAKLAETFKLSLL